MMMMMIMMEVVSCTLTDMFSLWTDVNVNELQVFVDVEYQQQPRYEKISLCMLCASLSTLTSSSRQ